MLAAAPGERTRVVVERTRQVGGRERYASGEAFGEGVERTVRGAGLGESVRGQEQGCAGRKDEPVDRRGFVCELGETERDTGCEGRCRHGGFLQHLWQDVTAVDGLRFRARVDVEDERGDEPFVVAGLRGIGVVPDDGCVQGVDKRGQSGLPVGRRTECADDGECGADRREALSWTSPISTRVPHGESTTS